MDDRWFDNVTRLIGSGASRRSILKGLLGLGGTAVAGQQGLHGADAQIIRTRPTLTTSPPPVCTPGHQFCGGQGPEFCCPPGRCFDGLCCDDPGTEGCGDACCPVGQCTTDGDCCPTGLKPCGSVCCAEASSCGRSGNTDICCGGPAGGAPCGLECCDDPYQCCDRECCGRDAVCMTTVFGGESPGIEEEVCCPAELSCDGQCCDGECYVPEGVPLAFDGFPFSLALAGRACCPAGNRVCQGNANAECCDPATQECCVRDGIASCIPLGGCCLDEECGDSCLVCEPGNWTCGNPCDAETPYCCPGEQQGYTCVANDDCCPGDECGECGECLDGSCAMDADFVCPACQSCAEQSTGLFACAVDPEKAAEPCDDCNLCGESGACDVPVPDTTPCNDPSDGICCAGVCSEPGSCTTTTTPDPNVCAPECSGRRTNCRLGECCAPVGACCNESECADICCSGSGGSTESGVCSGIGFSCRPVPIGQQCFDDSDCQDVRPTFCNDQFICEAGMRPSSTTSTTPGPVVTTTTTSGPIATTTTVGPGEPTTTTPGPVVTTTAAPACSLDTDCGSLEFCHEGNCVPDQCKTGLGECAPCYVCTNRLTGACSPVDCGHCRVCNETTRECETKDIQCCRFPSTCDPALGCSCNEDTGCLCRA